MVSSAGALQPEVPKIAFGTRRIRLFTDVNSVVAIVTTDLSNKLM